MTIEDRPLSKTVPGSAVVAGVGIDIPFDVQSISELAVLTGDDVPALLNVDYTVSLAGNYKSAVVYPLDGLVGKVNGGTVTIRSAVPYVQGWSVPINSRLPENDLQRTEDRDVLRDRQLAEEFDLSLHGFFNDPTKVSADGKRIADVGTPAEATDAARFQDLEALNVRLDDILASGGTSVVRDVATVFSAKAIPEAEAPDYYRVAGYDTVGDGGSGIWKREADVPGVPAALKFANGVKIFVNRSRRVTPEEAGAKGTGASGDAAANVTAFNAILNSSEHNWISIDKPGVYKLNAVLARTLLNYAGLVIDMHPDAELDFSGADFFDVPALELRGSLGAATAITLDALIGTTTITVASAAGFVIGQGAKVASAKRFDPSESNTLEAELGIVAAIAGSTITLLEPLNASYLLVDTPTLRPVTLQGKSRVIGGRLRGNPALVQSGLQVQYMNGLDVEGTHFVDWASRAVAFRDSLDGKIESIDVYGDATPDTGYGVSMWGCARGLSLMHSDFRRCRHGFTTNNSPEGGIPQDGTVFDNRVHSTAQDGNDALDTHCASRAMRFLYNWVYDSLGNGIHAQNPDVDIIGNRIYRTKYNAIVWVNESRYDGRATISDNVISDTLARGMFFAGASHGDTSGIGRLNVSRNEIYRATTEAIHLEDSSTGARAVRVDIDSNYIDGYGLAAISLEETDRFKIRDNEFEEPADAGRLGGQAGVLHRRPHHQRVSSAVDDGRRRQAWHLPHRL